MYAIHIMKHLPIQRIWGAMSKSGNRRATTTMNVARYVGILQQKLELYKHFRQYLIFTHGCVLCQRSKVVQNFYCSESIRQWSESNENLLEIAKRKAADKQTSTTEPAREHINEECPKEISIEYYNNLYSASLSASKR